MTMKINLYLILTAVLLTAVSASADAKCPKAELAVEHKTGTGNYLADEDGMTLYWFTKDSPGTSTCAGPCEEKWPVYYRDVFRIPKSMNGSDFASILRNDGKKQLTFRGYPLYYWAGDKKAGDTGGQGVNNVWFVVNPDNFPPK